MRQSCRRSTLTCHINVKGNEMSIDRALLEILACPQDKGPLWYVESENVLYNPRLKRAYAVVEGIPVMLIGESRTLSDADHDRIMGIISAQGIKPTFES